MLRNVNAFRSDISILEIRYQYRQAKFFERCRKRLKILGTYKQTRETDVIFLHIYKRTQSVTFPKVNRNVENRGRINRRASGTAEC